MCKIIYILDCEPKEEKKKITPKKKIKEPRPNEIK